MKLVVFHGYTIYEDGRMLTKTGREVRQRLYNGRYEVRITIEGERKNFVLPRLLYYVFKPFDITDKNLCVSFKDGDKLNVHLDNLYLIHRKDLIQGEKHTSIATLTDDQAQEIREIYKGKAGTNQHDKTSPSLLDLAKKYGTTRHNIKFIVTGRSRNKKEYKLK